jgi:hypothetical protein
MLNWMEVEVQRATDIALRYTAHVFDLVPRVDAAGKSWTMVHVDFSDDEHFVRMRQGLLTSTGLPGMVLDLPVARAPCQFRHTAENCKCHLPIMHLGQDEAIYRENAMS